MSGSPPLTLFVKTTAVLGTDFEAGAACIYWGFLSGAVGLGFFTYGKKQHAVVPLICGLALMVFPYFISNTILLVVIGVALMAVPFFVRI